MSELYGEGAPEAVAVRAATKTEYDARWGYRFMEALRNHIQHRSLPLTSMTYPSSIDGQTQPPRWRFGVSPRISLRQLREDSKFKSGVLDRFSETEEYIEVGPPMREYVEGLCGVLQVARAQLIEDVSRWDEVLLSARAEALAALPDAKTELAVVAESEAGIRDSVEYIPEHIITHRQALERKNSTLANLSRRYVSSETGVGSS